MSQQKAIGNFSIGFQNSVLMIELPTSNSTKCEKLKEITRKPKDKGEGRPIHGDEVQGKNFPIDERFLWELRNQEEDR